MEQKNKINWNKIIFIVAVISMCGSVFGIFGGILFQSITTSIIGLSIWAVGLVFILSKAMYNMLNL